MKLRKSNRTCYCRFCDKEIERNTEDVIYEYSYRNKGQHIFICKDCIKEAYNLVVESEGE